MQAVRVRDVPDVLPLRDAAGRELGRFSDHGSWLEAGLEAGGRLAVHDGLSGRVARIELEPGVQRCTVWCDGLELELVNSTAWLGFADADTLLLETSADGRVRTEGLAARRVRRGWLLGRRCEADPPDDLRRRNRARWDAALARAHAACGRPSRERDRLLLARAVTTLLWNARAAAAEQPHAGVIPSPFAYRGYWGWDSSKHAWALAGFAPGLAAEQLRAQTVRQRADGMVADTARPEAGDDHWDNTKPAMFTWALERVYHATGDRGLVEEILPRCLAFLRWWDDARRLPGAVLHSCGGIDTVTAAWDSGWDDAVRFEGVPLVDIGPWRLWDLWSPDTNAYHLVELRAAARLAPLTGIDPEPWRRRAAAHGRALRGLWDARLGAFADTRSDGTSTGRLSLAAVLPVWAEAADAAQTAATRERLRDPQHFATAMPFPSLAASQDGFDPDGYWNGGVWLDHAALALAVLGRDGTELRERLLDHVAAAGALWECHSPRTGAPVAGARPAVPQFSWSAAAVLAILAGGPWPRAERAGGR